MPKSQFAIQVQLAAAAGGVIQLNMKEHRILPANRGIHQVGVKTTLKLCVSFGKIQNGLCITGTAKDNVNGKVKNGSRLYMPAMVRTSPRWKLYYVTL